MKLKLEVFFVKLFLLSVSFSLILEYIHRNHVAHRDIKLENIRYNNFTGNVKLLDFGFASFYAPKYFLETNCGSPCYACPEIYDNKPYDPQLVDIWSLGVCLFGMVTGSLPFDGNDFKTLAASVRSGKISYPEKCVNLSKGNLKFLCRFERITDRHAQS
jgi:serine/threonine protein kinase